MIKWSVKTLLIITGIIPFTRCSSGYKNDNGKITFDGKEITDKNFVVLSDEFARDSSTAYYKSRAFSYADVPTFQAVDKHYAKDKDRVYYCDEYREGQNYYLTKKQTILTVRDAVPAKFQSLGSGYGKDNLRPYFEGVAFKVKDLATLEVININFLKDKHVAYINRLPIAGSDGETFEVIDGSYAKDTSHVYFYNAGLGDNKSITVMSCDKASFDTLQYPFSKDKQSAFYEGKKIDGADGASFTAMGSGYSKDKNGVFFGTKRISPNVASFEIFADNDPVRESFTFAKDNANVFIDDKVITGADIGTFKILALGYGMDAKHVFFKTRLVKDANPATFKTYQHSYGDTDAEDGQIKYLEGKKVIAE